MENLDSAGIGRTIAHGRAAALRRARWRTTVLLGGLVAGWSGTVGADGVRWSGLRGPQCPLGQCLGPLWCPGCGLARATASALQGDLGAAVAWHPAGPVIAVLLLSGALLHFDILRRRCEYAGHTRLRRLGRWLFGASLLGGWCLRLTLATDP